MKHVLGLFTLLCSAALVFGDDSKHLLITKPRNTQKIIGIDAVRGRTSPDAHRINNYSFKGNINPATGKKGTRGVGIRRVKGQP